MSRGVEQSRGREESKAGGGRRRDGDPDGVVWDPALPMMITARGLNRATLGRQLLLQREALGVTDAMRRVVALQAQAAPSPYLALWNRLAGFDPAELDAAFARGEMVKATLMRVTLHAVHAGDYQVFRQAMEPALRAARIGDRLRVSDVTHARDDRLI